MAAAQEGTVSEWKENTPAHCITGEKGESGWCAVLGRCFFRVVLVLTLISFHNQMNNK